MWYNFILIIANILITCAAQLLMRKGMMEIGTVSLSTVWSHMGAIVQCGWLWLSGLCYVVSMLLWMIVLSRLEVGYAYPFLSLGYVVAAVAGYYFWDESLSLLRIAGILVICIGVFMVAKS